LITFTILQFIILFGIMVSSALIDLLIWLSGMWLARWLVWLFFQSGLSISIELVIGPRNGIGYKVDSGATVSSLYM